MVEPVQKKTIKSDTPGESQVILDLHVWAWAEERMDGGMAQKMSTWRFKRKNNLNCIPCTLQGRPITRGSYN